MQNDFKECFPLNHVAELMPIPKPHKSTLCRWATEGVRGKVLKTIMIGGRRYTNLQAVDEFLAQADDSETHNTTWTPSVIEKELDRILGPIEQSQQEEDSDG